MGEGLSLVELVSEAGASGSRRSKAQDRKAIASGVEGGDAMMPCGWEELVLLSPSPLSPSCGRGLKAELKDLRAAAPGNFESRGNEGCGKGHCPSFSEPESLEHDSLGTQGKCY